MMDISIPDAVLFYTGEWRNKDYNERYYCFAHAILRALEGEKIQVKLTYSDRLLSGCDDCRDFGSPASHDLSSLRRAVEV